MECFARGLTERPPLSYKDYLESFDNSRVPLPTLDPLYLRASKVRGTLLDREGPSVSTTERI